MKRIGLQLILLGITIGAVTGVAFSNYDKARSNQLSPTKNATHMVMLEKDGAKPDIVTINIGDTVQFNSRDGRSHQIVEEPGKEHASNNYPLATLGEWLIPKASAHGEERHKSGGLKSAVFGPDEAFQIRFDERGIKTFGDHLNSGFSIVVVVAAGKI